MNQIHSRRTVLAATVAAIAAGLTGCGDDGTGAPTSASGKTKVTVQVDGAAVPYYAPLYLAKEKGYFADAGLDVEFVYADASTVLKNVAAGNVQFGFPNGDAVISAVANDIPVKVIHTTYQQGIGALLSLKKSGIAAPADLKGKTVAVTSIGSPNYVQLEVMAKQAGLDVKKDLTVKTIGTGAIVDSLKNGQVDAIVFSRLRYYALQAAGVQVNQLLTDSFLPSFGNVLVAGDSVMKETPDLAKGFVTAFDKALNDVIQGGAQEAVTMSIAKYAPDFKGEEAQITKIMTEVFIAQLYQSAQTKSHGLGHGDLARWQQAADVQQQHGLIKKKLDAGTFVVQPSAL